MNKICYGCGVKLQSEKSDKLGYVPVNKINDAKYCMRCFRGIHYGEESVVSTPKEAKEIINKVNKDVRFVIFLVDFLNINKEVIAIFKSIKKRKLLVVNKCELLPSQIKKEKLISYLENYYEVSEPIKLKGGKTNHGAKAILNYLEDNDIKETYILGISNSGKSTLINDLLNISGSKMTRVNVNSKANTTLDFIRVKLGDVTLIDSPGFIIGKSLNHDVLGKSITAYSMNMKMGQTLSLLDNKYFLKFDENNTSLTFYTNAMAKHVVKKYFKAAPNLVNTIIISKENTDIVIYGIGFITIKSPCLITTNIALEAIELRDSMFGGTNEQNTSNE